MSHDYDPSWDYTLVEPIAGDQQIIDAVVDEMKALICPVLGIADFTVFIPDQFSFHEGESVGIYIDGTSSKPVIGIDLQTLKESSDEYGVNWVDQVRATMIHELAHAFEEATGCELHDENAVEEFARTYVMEGIVDFSILQPAGDSLSP